MHTFDLISQLLQRTYPTLTFAYTFKAIYGENGVEYHMLAESTDPQFSVAISPVSRFADIRRIVDGKLNQAISGLDQRITCSLCTEDSRRSVSCNRCGGSMCVECMARCFEEGRGLITCPFCRLRTGREHNETAVAMGAAEIRSRNT